MASRPPRGSTLMARVMWPTERGTNTSKRGCSMAATISSATSSGVTCLTPRVSCRPAASSVLTTTGITHETSMPKSLTSARMPSEAPTTKCLVPQ